jgi:putative toxin-antitoxin system antitoxin component (TIGR02293 family)
MTNVKPQGFSEQPQPFTYADVIRGIPASSLRGYEARGLRREDIRMIIADRTLERRIAAGDMLKVEEVDGIARLLRLVKHAMDVFENSENADLFLHSPNPVLDNAIPMRMAKTELGAQEVHVILGRIEHGLFS